jgi:hypothetical protein
MTDVMVIEDGEIYRAWHTVEYTSVGKDLIPVTIDYVGCEWIGKDFLECV